MCPWRHAAAAQCHNSTVVLEVPGMLRVEPLGVFAGRQVCPCVALHAQSHLPAYTAARAPPCRQLFWRMRRSAGRSMTMKHSCARHQQQLGAHLAAPAAAAWQQRRRRQRRARRLRCLAAAAAAEQVGLFGFALSPVEVFVPVMLIDFHKLSMSRCFHYPATRRRIPTPPTPAP